MFKQLAGGYQALGINTAGAAYAWGFNSSGQLGLGDVTPRSSPVLVLGGKTWKWIATGFSCSYGIDSNDDAYAWGINTNGNLGLGDVTPRSSPVLVLGGLKWRRIYGSMSGRYAAGITTSGDAYAWGAGSNGQLGNGGVTARSSPVLVLGGLKWQSLNASVKNAVIGFATNGSAYAWGLNDFGQLGVGDVTPRSSPVLVLGSLLWRSVDRASVAEQVITVVPGTTYSMTMFAAVTLFNVTPLYADSSNVGSLPTEVTLEYFA